ncbi:hypothetical protein GCM10017600_10910 [Streptosporangium carneum]|uniref:Uncharacterized protein n=1 Tax=Streptosporangium carneum TaxID=47481 RepID=A0A9W6HXQ5_9ACTN|nr:hypothetical protein GCM10017600_10910 [Streptosporangium carneum]
MGVGRPGLRDLASAGGSRLSKVRRTRITSRILPETYPDAHGAPDVGASRVRGQAPTLFLRPFSASLSFTVLLAVLLRSFSAVSREP